LPILQSDKNRIILSREHAVLIYDGYPVTIGHCLVPPARHISSFFEATKDEQLAMLDLLTKAQLLLLSERNIAGFNIGINDGPAAGQTIMHLHIHLIPRYLGDIDNPRGGVRWIIPENGAYWEK
jgi:diadenosine tetraphosphate (Ap4A) HIT family hydrolase